MQVKVSNSLEKKSLQLSHSSVYVYPYSANKLAVQMLETWALLPESVKMWVKKIVTVKFISAISLLL